MRKKQRKTVIAAMILLIFGAVMLYAAASGVLNRDPRVEITADNCYAQAITVVMGEDFAPFSFKKDGEYQGHDVELANELANRLQMNVRLEFYSWSECIEKVRSGEADMLMSADYELPIEGISYSIPTDDNPWIAFSDENTPDIDGYIELYGKRIGIGEGTDPLADENLKNSYAVFKSYDEAFDALEQGIVDTVITQYQVGTYIAEKAGHGTIKADCEITDAHQCIGVKADNTGLLRKVNAVLAVMYDDGTLEQLNRKWCGSFVKTYTLKELSQSYQEYFISSIIALLVIISLLALLLIRGEGKHRETRLREKLELQNQLIKHFVREYSEVYYIHMEQDKEQDTSELLFKGGIVSDEVMPPDMELPFAKKLDYFIENIVYEPDRERVNQMTRREDIIKNISDGEVYPVDFRTLKGGKVHYYQIRFAKVQEEGELTGFVVGLRLVDDSVRLMNQLAEEKAKAETASNAKTAFLFNMSHDIRTPMNAILGFTEMAKKNIDNPGMLEDCLSKTQQAGSLLLSLINSVLEMSRIEYGKAELNEQPRNVRNAFDNIDTTMQALAGGKDIDISFECGDIADCYIYVDPDRFNRILVNIISNAIKYTNPGGWIKARCEQTGRQDDAHGLYRITVADNGIGMSEEFQEHLFDEFARESSSTDSGVQGSGLGLSVVRSFVELMHGNVECQSRKGEGTTFIVTLPLRLLSEEEIVSYTAEQPAENAGDINAETRSGKPGLAGRRILLVEDNDMNREIAAFVLEQESIIVEEATDGTEAVELLQEKGADYYDAVLMDIQMPVMNGYDATKAIRAMYPDSKLPIIALSANAFAEDKIASIAAGMDDHIAKPINTTELLEALTRLMQP